MSHNFTCLSEKLMFNKVITDFMEIQEEMVSGQNFKELKFFSLLNICTIRYKIDDTHTCSN